jgi:uncharacterized protein YcgL (UPF0745 family)
MDGLNKHWVVIPCIPPSARQMAEVSFSNIAELCQRLDTELKNEFAGNGKYTLVFNLDSSRNLTVEDFNTVCEKVSTHSAIESFGISVNNKVRSITIYNNESYE